MSKELPKMYQNKINKTVDSIQKVYSTIDGNKSFDESCLKAVFRTYQMDYPDYEFYCTYQAALCAFPDAPSHQLHTISELCGHKLNKHHHALADAEACAWIARNIL